MKKITVIVVLSLLVVAALLGGCKKEERVFDIKSATAAVMEGINYDSTHYTYKTTKKEADIIARVTITDDLTNRNSIVKTDDDGKVVEFYSQRRASITKLYKAPDGFDGETIVIRDTSAAISNDGKLYRVNLDTIQKNTEYIIFVKKTDGENEFVLISPVNSVFKTSDLENHIQNNLAYMFILDYETPEKNALVETLLTLSDTYMDDGSFNEFYPKQEIDTNYGRICVQQAKTTIDGELFYYVFKEGDDNTILNVTNIFKYIKYNK